MCVWIYNLKKLIDLKVHKLPLLKKKISKNPMIARWTSSKKNLCQRWSLGGPHKIPLSHKRTSCCMLQRTCWGRKTELSLWSPQQIGNLVLELIWTSLNKEEEEAIFLYMGPSQSIGRSWLKRFWTGKSGLRELDPMKETLCSDTTTIPQKRSKSSGKFGCLHCERLSLFNIQMGVFTAILSPN